MFTQCCIRSFLLRLFFKLRLQNSIFKILRSSLLKRKKCILNLYLHFVLLHALKVLVLYWCLPDRCWKTQIGWLADWWDVFFFFAYLIWFFSKKYIPKDVYVRVKNLLVGVNFWPLRLYFLFFWGSAVRNLLSQRCFDPWEAWLLSLHHQCLHSLNLWSFDYTPHKKKSKTNQQSLLINDLPFFYIHSAVSLAQTSTKQQSRSLLKPTWDQLIAPPAGAGVQWTVLCFECKSCKFWGNSPASYFSRARRIAGLHQMKHARS